MWRTVTKRKEALVMRPSRIPRSQFMFRIGQPQIAESELSMVVEEQRLVDKGGGLTTPQPK